MNEKTCALESINEYILNLINKIGQLAEYFQVGENEKGCKLIYSITEEIEWVCSELINKKHVHNNDIILQNINEKLKDIVYALENKDFVLIGDLFEYEIIPILKQLKKL